MERTVRARLQERSVSRALQDHRRPIAPHVADVAPHQARYLLSGIARPTAACLLHGHEGKCRLFHTPTDRVRTEVHMMRRIVFLFLVTLAVSSLPLQAAPIVFATTLTGPNEEPPYMSPATGYALVTIDAITHMMRVEVSF